MVRMALNSYDYIHLSDQYINKSNLAYAFCSSYRLDFVTLMASFLCSTTLYLALPSLTLFKPVFTPLCVISSSSIHGFMLFSLANCSMVSISCLLPIALLVNVNWPLMSTCGGMLHAAEGTATTQHTPPRRSVDSQRTRVIDVMEPVTSRRSNCATRREKVSTTIHTTLLQPNTSSTHLSKTTLDAFVISAF